MATAPDGHRFIALAVKINVDELILFLTESLFVFANPDDDDTSTVVTTTLSFAVTKRATLLVSSASA